MERIAAEFLRAVRGRRSQVQFARRLGYRGNPVTDWERGARFPTAEEALRAAAVAGVDVEATFARFLPSVPLGPTAGKFLVAPWLARLRGATPVTELAVRCGLSRFTVARCLKGQVKPRLPDFFRLVDALTGRLPEWVAEFVPIEQVASLECRFRAVRAAKRLAFEVPWTEAVLRLLETQDYRKMKGSRSGFIAARLGIGRAQEGEYLRRLEEAGLVERKRGGYRVLGRGTVDTHGAGKEALQKLKEHWARVAADRLRASREEDLFAYNVVSLSRADLDRVREILRAAFREIRALVAASEPEEVAALVNLQLVVFASDEPESP